MALTMAIDSSEVDAANLNGLDNGDINSSEPAISELPSSIQLKLTLHHPNGARPSQYINTHGHPTVIKTLQQ
jgi:hypothetical protein